jgi:hypothetical protein
MENKKIFTEKSCKNLINIGIIVYLLNLTTLKYNSKWIDDLAKQRYKIKMNSERQITSP